MAIAKKWSDYTKENLKTIPDEYIGSYEIGHHATNTILYIGEGKIKNRLLAHFPDGKRPEEIVVGADVFRYETTNTKAQAVLQQNHHLADFKAKNNQKLPKYNQRSKN